MALLSAALVFLAPTIPVQAAPGDITLTVSVSSISGAEFRSVDVYGPGGWLPVVEDGDTFTVTGPPGAYSVYVSEDGGPQGDDWYFYGQTEPTVYTQDSTIQVTVPLHTLALDVENADGSPAPADVELDCCDATPPGWQYADSYADRHVNGVSSFLVANHAAGDEDCDLRVDPDIGPTRTFLVPGNASTYTAVVNAGVHVQGTVSDGLGHAAPAGVTVEAYDEDGAALSSWTETDAAGHYDLYLEPGSYTFDVYSASSTALDGYWLHTMPIDVSTDRSLDLAPVIDTLTVHARTPGGQPAPSSAQLDCSRDADGSDAHRLAEHLQHVGHRCRPHAARDGVTGRELQPQAGSRRGALLQHERLAHRRRRRGHRRGQPRDHRHRSGDGAGDHDLHRRHGHRARLAPPATSPPPPWRPTAPSRSRKPLRAENIVTST